MPTTRAKASATASSARPTSTPAPTPATSITALEGSWEAFLSSSPSNEPGKTTAADASGLSKLEAYTAIHDRFSAAHSNWKSKYDTFRVALATPAAAADVSVTPEETTIQTLSDNYTKQGAELEALLASVDMDDPHVDRVMQLWHRLEHTHATLLAHLNQM
jgi:hypothetical protein